MFSVLKRKADSPCSLLAHPAASGTSSASGACDHGLLFGSGALLRKGLDTSPRLLWCLFELHHPGRAAAGCRRLFSAPSLPAPRDARPRLGTGAQGSPYRQRGPDIFHSLLCSPLPFLNPAPGLEKPLNETHCNLLAGQKIMMPFRAPRQEGFCWSP